MKKIFERQAVESALQLSPYRHILEEFLPELFLISYGKAELVTSPFPEEKLFQVVVHGSLNIYFIRDDGASYSLSSGKAGNILGDMEFFRPETKSIYTEAAEDSLFLAISIDKNRDMLMASNGFLQLLCSSLSRKLELITAMDAAPASLSDRLISYMKYRCPQGTLKGLEREAFHLHCSARQLQRILNRLEQEGQVEKLGKGCYRLK